jgi:hypothetical protein
MRSKNMVSNYFSRNNPITRGRRILGGIIVLIGIIMIIPSIVGFVWANNIYEGSYKDGKTASITSTTQVSDVIVLDVTGVLKSGNNYDIVVKATGIQGPQTQAETGLLTVSCVITNGVSQTGAKSTGKFNESYGSMTLINMEIKNPIEADKDPKFTFTITAIADITSATLEIRIYENPNRALVNTINTIALVMLIPGICIIVCGAIIAPPNRKGAGRRR